MRDAAISRRALDTDLRHAINRDELEACYQPIMDLRTGAIAAFEASVRWRHPGRGILSAADFVPVAEENGLVVDLALWLLEHAAADLGAHAITISLDVSERELADPRYMAAVRSTITSALPPAAVMLELSCNATFHDAPEALANLHALKALGIQIALDDFGIGRTSLLELTTLPLDLLKIAAPFIPRNPAYPRTDALLTTILEIADRLELTSVAQGLDRPEQLPLLVNLGCTLGQGALPGAAVDASTAHSLLAAHRRSERSAPSRAPVRSTPRAGC